MPILAPPWRLPLLEIPCHAAHFVLLSSSQLITTHLALLPFTLHTVAGTHAPNFPNLAWRFLPPRLCFVFPLHRKVSLFFSCATILFSSAHLTPSLTCLFLIFGNTPFIPLYFQSPRVFHICPKSCTFHISTADSNSANFSLSCRLTPTIPTLLVNPGSTQSP